MRNRSYIVDLNSKSYQVGRYKQFDNGINYTMELVENGEPVNLENCIVKAFFQIPNGEILQKDCEINKNIITTKLDNNILKFVGDVSVEISIYKADIIITTFTIKLEVEKSINKNEAIQKEPVWDIIANLLELDTTVQEKMHEIDNNIINIKNQLDDDVLEKFEQVDNILEDKLEQIQEQIDTKEFDIDNKIIDCEDRMQDIEDKFDSLIDGTGFASKDYVDEAINNINIDTSPLQNQIDENKNDISNINYELSKTENTKYTTTNGVKEFSCKDGYVDNVVIEGKTLVNLGTIASKHVGVDAIRTRFENTGDDYKQRYSNNTFTLVNFTDKIISFPSRKNDNKTWGSQYDVQPYSKWAVQIPSDTSLIGADFWNVNGWAISNDTIISESYFAILEGDHSDKPISYFEGLKSVGQGNRIEVISQGKNIFDGLFEYGSIKNVDGSLEYKAECIRSVNYIPIYEKELYSWNDKGYSFITFYYDINKNFISSGGNIPPKNARYLKFRTSYNSNQNDLSVRWVVSYKEVNSYTPSQHDKKQISTTLRSLPNGVRDTIEKRGNTYVKVQRCKEILIDGSSYHIGTAKTNTIDHCIPISDIKMGTVAEKSLYCDVVNVVEGITDWSNTDFEFITVDTTKKYIVISLLKTKVSEQSQELFKGYVSSNPITIVYELETPQIIELPNFNPQTYSDNTTLLINSGAIQGECEFEVTNSKGSEIEVLKDKVSNVEEFLINNKYNYQKHQLIQDNGLAINIAGRDLNTILTTMIASGNNMVNAPTGDWYYFEIISHSANSTMQIATKTTTTGSGVSGQRFIRTTEDGGFTWSAWKEFTTTSTIALEEQVLALQEENQALREELTQIQTSIASLTSLIPATLEEK